MDSQEKLRKIEAAKRKLEKHKKKQVISASNSSNVTNDRLELINPHQLVYNSHMASSEVLSEVSSSKNAASQINEKVIELEEILIGKQSVIDSLIEENETLKAKLVADGSDVNNDDFTVQDKEVLSSVKEYNLRLTELENGIQAKDNTIKKLMENVQSLTRSRDDLQMEYTTQIDQLTTHVHTLQSQLKQAGQWLHNQIGESSALALMEAKDEILALQRDSSQKESQLKALQEAIKQRDAAMQTLVIQINENNLNYTNIHNEIQILKIQLDEKSEQLAKYSTENESRDFLGSSSDVYDQFKESLRGFSSSNKVQGISNDEFISTTEKILSALRAELDEFYGIEINKIKDCLNSQHQSELRRLKAEVIRLDEERSRFSYQATKCQEQYVLLSQQNISTSDLVQDVGNVLTENIRLNQLVDELRAQIYACSSKNVSSSSSGSSQVSQTLDVMVFEKGLQELDRLKSENSEMEKIFFNKDQLIQELEDQISTLQEELKTSCDKEREVVRQTVQAEFVQVLQKNKEEIEKLQGEKSKLLSEISSWQRQYILLSQQNVSSTDLVEQISSVVTENIRLNQLIDELNSKSILKTREILVTSDSIKKLPSNGYEMDDLKKEIEELKRVKHENEVLEKTFFTREQFDDELESKLDCLKNEFMEMSKHEFNQALSGVTDECNLKVSKMKEDLQNSNLQREKLDKELNSWRDQYIKLSQQSLSNSELLEEINNLKNENLNLIRVQEDLKDKSLTLDKIRDTSAIMVTKSCQCDSTREYENEFRNLMFTREQLEEEVEKQLSMQKSNLDELYAKDICNIKEDITIDFTRDIEKLKKELKFTSEERSKYFEEAKTWQNQYFTLSNQSLLHNDLEEQLNLLKNENHNLKSTIDDLNSQVKILMSDSEQNLLRYNHEVSVANKEIDESKSKIYSLNLALSAESELKLNYNNKIKSFQNEIEILRSKHSEEIKHITTDLELEINMLKTQLHDAKAKGEQLVLRQAEEITNLKSSLQSQNNTEIEKLKNDLTCNITELQLLRNEYDQLRSKHQTDLDSFNNLITQLNSASKNATTEKENIERNLNEIIGSLNDKVLTLEMDLTDKNVSNVEEQNKIKFMYDEKIVSIYEESNNLIQGLKEKLVNFDQMQSKLTELSEQLDKVTKERDSTMESLQNVYCEKVELKLNYDKLNSEKERLNKKVTKFSDKNKFLAMAKAALSRSTNANITTEQSSRNMSASPIVSDIEESQPTNFITDQEYKELLEEKHALQSELIDCIPESIVINMGSRITLPKEKKSVVQKFDKSNEDIDENSLSLINELKTKHAQELLQVKKKQIALMEKLQAFMESQIKMGGVSSVSENISKQDLKSKSNDISKDTLDNMFKEGDGKGDDHFYNLDNKEPKQIISQLAYQQELNPVGLNNIYLDEYGIAENVLIPDPTSATNSLKLVKNVEQSFMDEEHSPKKVVSHTRLLEIQQLRSQLLDANEKIQALENEKEIMINEFDLKLMSLTEEYKKSKISLNNEIENLNMEVNELIEKLKQNNSNWEKIVAEKDAVINDKLSEITTITESHAQALNDIVSKHEEKETGLNHALFTSKMQLSALESKIESIDKEKIILEQEYVNEMEELTKEHDSRMRSIKEMFGRESREMSSKLNEYEEKILNLTDELEFIQQDNLKLSEKLSKMKAEVVDSTQTNRGISSEETWLMRLNCLEETKFTIEKCLDDAKADIDILNVENKKLSSELEEIKKLKVESTSVEVETDICYDASEDVAHKMKCLREEKALLASMVERLTNEKDQLLVVMLSRNQNLELDLSNMELEEEELENEELRSDDPRVKLLETEKELLANMLEKVSTENERLLSYFKLKEQLEMEVDDADDLKGENLFVELKNENFQLASDRQSPAFSDQMEAIQTLETEKRSLELTIESQNLLLNEKQQTIEFLTNQLESLNEPPTIISSEESTIEPTLDSLKDIVKDLETNMKLLVLKLAEKEQIIEEIVISKTLEHQQYHNLENIINTCDNELHSEHTDSSSTQTERSVVTTISQKPKVVVITVKSELHPSDKFEVVTNNVSDVELQRLADFNNDSEDKVVPDFSLDNYQSKEPKADNQSKLLTIKKAKLLKSKKLQEKNEEKESLSKQVADLAESKRSLENANQNLLKEIEILMSDKLLQQSKPRATMSSEVQTIDDKQCGDYEKQVHNLQDEIMSLKLELENKFYDAEKCDKLSELSTHEKIQHDVAVETDDVSNKFEDFETLLNTCREDCIILKEQEACLISENKILQDFNTELNLKLENKNSELDTASNELRCITRRCEDLDKEISTIKDRELKKDKDLSELNENIAVLNIDNNSKIKEINVLQDKITILAEANSEIEKDRLQTSARENSFEKELNALVENANVLNEELKAKREFEERIKHENEEIKIKCCFLESKLNESERWSVEMKDHYHNKEEEKSILESQLKEEINTLKSKLESAEMCLSKISNEKLSLEKLIVELTEKEKIYLNRLSDLTKVVSEFDQDKVVMENQIHELEINLEMEKDNYSNTLECLLIAEQETSQLRTKLNDERHKHQVLKDEHDEYHASSEGKRKQLLEQLDISKLQLSEVINDCQKLKHKFEECQSNLNDKNEFIKRLENDRQVLRVQIKDFLPIQEELIIVKETLQNEKNAKNIFEEECACKISLLNNEVEGLRKDLGTKTNNCLELESIIDELQKDLQVKCEAIIKAEENNAAMRVQLMEVKSVQEELISLRNNFEHEKNLKVEIEKYHEVDIKELKAQIDHLRTELDVTNDKFKGLQLDMEAVQKLLEEKCVALSCSEQDNHSLKTRINNLESIQIELTCSREALEHERLLKASLETELESQILNTRQSMELELKAKSDECLNLQLVVKDLTNTLNEKTDVMKEIETNNASLKSQMNDFENLHNELITLREVFQSEKNAKADLEAKRANEVSKLKEEMKIFKNNLESEIKSKDDECFKLQEIIQNMQKNLDQRCMQSEEDSNAIICKSSEIESMKTKLLSVTKSFEEEKNAKIELTKSHAMELTGLRNEIENLKSCQDEYLKKLNILTKELEETKHALNVEIFMSEENCKCYNSNIEILINEHDQAFNNLNKNIEIIVASHESRNKQLELENSQIIEEKLKLHAESKQLENTIEDLRSQNAKQTLEIDNTKKSLDNISMKYIETQQKNKLCEEDLETKCNEVLEKENTIQELMKKCSDLEHELSMMTNKNFAISEECQQIRLNFENSLITITAQQDEVINLKNEKYLLNTRFEELEHALSDRERAVGSLQENLNKATSELHALQKKSDDDKLNHIEITNSLKNNVSLFMEQLKASEINAKYFDEQFQLLNSEKISVCKKLGITSDDEADNLLEKIDSLKHSIDDFNEKEINYKNLISSLGINNDKLKNEIRTLEMQFSTKCLEVKDLENLFEQQLTSITECNREEILNMMKEIECKSSESDHLKCCLIDIENKLKSIENESNVLEDKLERRESEISEKQCALNKLQISVQELNGHLNLERNKIIEKESKLISLQDEILILRNKLMLQDGEFSLKQSELMNTINNLSNQLNNANLSHSEQQMKKDHPDLLSSNLLMSENNSELENKACIHEKNLLHIDDVSGSFVENQVESIIKRKPTCYVFNYSTTNNEDDKNSVCSSKTTKLEHAKLLKTKKLQEKEITKLKEKCVELENMCKKLQSDCASAAEEMNRIDNEKHHLIYQISSLEEQLKYDRPEKPNVDQIDESIECCILNTNELKKLCTTNSYCPTLQEAHYQNTHLEEQNDVKELVVLKIENQSQDDGAIQADATTSETFKHFQEFEIEEATLVKNMEEIYLAGDHKMVCNKSYQDVQLDTSDLYNENPKEFRNASVETESKSQAVSSSSQTDLTLSDFNDAKISKDAATETSESVLDTYANSQNVPIDNSILSVMKEAAEFYGTDTRTSVQVKSHEDVKAHTFELSSEHTSPSIEVASTPDDMKNCVDVAVETIINQYDIDNMKADIKELNEIIDDLKNKIIVLDEEKLNLEKNYGQMNERHIELDSQNESLKNQLLQLTDDYKDKEDSYKKDLNKLMSDLHQATSENKVSTCDKEVATLEIASKNKSVENANPERSHLIDILHSVFGIPLELDDSSIECHLIKFKNNLQNRNNVMSDEGGKEHKSSYDEEETSLDRRELETALETLESLTFADTDEVTRIVNNLKPQIKVLCRSDVQNSKKCDELVHQRDLLKEENRILMDECEKLRSDFEQLKQESERAFNALKLSCFDHVNQFDRWGAVSTNEAGGGLLSASFLASGLKSPSSFSGSETFLMSDDGRLSRSEIDEFQTKVSNLERENTELKMSRDDSGSSDGHLRLSSFQSETSAHSLQESPDDVDKVILDQMSPIGRKSFSPSTSLNVERFLIRTPRSITSTSNDYQLETKEAKGKTTEDYMYLQNEFKKFKQKVRTEYTKLKNRLVETLKDYNYLKLKYQEVCDANRFHSLCDNNLLFSENNALRIQILDLENTISCLERENKTIDTSNADDPNKSIEDVKQLNEKLVQQELQISILQSDCNCLSERNALLEKQLLETEKISSFELQTDLPLLETLPLKGDMKETSNKSQRSVSKLPVRAVLDQKKSKAIHAKDFSQSIKSEPKASVRSCPSKESVSSQKEAAQSKPLKVVSSVRQDSKECKRCQNLEKECEELKKTFSRSSREESQELRSADPDEDDDNAGVTASKVLLPLRLTMHVLIVIISILITFQHNSCLNYCR